MPGFNPFCAVIAVASGVVSGVALHGRSAGVAPVRGGTTDLGTVIMRRGGRLFGSSSVQGTNPSSLFVIDTDIGVATLVGRPANTFNGISDVSGVGRLIRPSA